MEVRHFLMNFVQDHYSRNRATIRDGFIRQLYFLDASRSRALTEEEAKTKSIPAFPSSSDDEVDINVRNVAIEDLRAATKQPWTSKRSTGPPTITGKSGGNASPLTSSFPFWTRFPTTLFP